MVIKAGDLLYKYTLHLNGLVLQVGAVEDCGKKKYIHFDIDTEPEGFPGYKNINRVWKDGKTLWLYERDDELAKRLFTEFGVDHIAALQKEIDETGEMITKIRRGEVKTMSRCFGDFNAYCDEEKVAVEQDETVNPTEEFERSRKDSWKDDFKNPTQYVAHKLKMLRNEMYIHPSVEEIMHLRSLKTQTAIDNAVHSIIDRHWG